MIRFMYPLFFMALIAIPLISGWDDFFHPPSSQSPLGGGLKIPKLPSVPKSAEIFKKGVNGARNWSRDRVSLESQQSSGANSPDVTASRNTGILMSTTRGKNIDVQKAVVGEHGAKVTLKGLLLRRKAPSVVWTVTIIGLALTKFLLIWRKRSNDATSTSSGDQGKEFSGGVEQSAKGVWKWRPFGESTRRSVEKIQNDQEECWRVLHSIYKKHATLEDSVKLLQEKQTKDSSEVLEDAEELRKHVGLLESQMKELDSMPDSLKADITEIRTILSSCATKAELEKMAKLVKDFVENLKEAL